MYTVNAVMYAADLGERKIDMHKFYTRDEVYGMRSDISATDLVPPCFMPEDDSFRVVQIISGNYVYYVMATINI